MQEYYQLKNILTILVSQIKKQDFLVYFRKMSILEVKNDTIVFGVVSNFMKENLEAKFYNEILKAVKQEIHTINNIEFEVDDKIDNPSNNNSIDCMQFFKDNAKGPKSKSLSGELNFGTPITKSQESTTNNTNCRYSLENFIVGSDNQLAFSACEAVAKNPGKSYNPLYIYGDVGLGKTHLLQATGNAISKRFKDKKVLYTTADKFITEYVTAVKKRSVDSVRQKYKEIDVLVIDDVQFLSKKEQTQIELYNVFNLLYEQNKQIIISGDRAPKELEELEPRLRSRFEWGITVDIGIPDYETRLAIIQEKARQKEFLLPQDVAEFIAANVTENVRELEGILNQMIAEFELHNAIPTLDKIASKLKKLSFTDTLIGMPRTNTLGRIKIKNSDDIVEAVSKYFGIEKDGILGDVRKKEFMIPRQVSMYLLKTQMNYTYEKIGNIFSGRNHAAVLYSCNKLQDLLKKDKNLLYDVNNLRDSIGFK